MISFEQETQDKMFQFISTIQDIQVLSTDFWKSVFGSMDDLFGLKGVQFFPFSNSAFLMPFSAQGYGDDAEQRHLNRWLKQYSHIDPFNPMNYSPHNKRQKVVMLRDLTDDFTARELEEYVEYRKSNFIRDQMTSQLVAQNNLFGCLVVSRYDDEEEFCERDRQLFWRLNEYVEKHYNLLRLQAQEHAQNLLLYSTIDQVDEGVLLLDAQYNLTYINEAGRRVVSDLTGLKEAEFGLRKLLPQILHRQNCSDKVAGVVGGYEYQLSTIMQPEIGFSPSVMYLLRLKSGPAPSSLNKDNLGQYMLTDREQEILEMIYAGDSNQDIADSLYISIHTVKTHIYNIYKKMNVRRRLELIKILESN